MKLFEKLDKMKDDEIIAIGTKNGTGFVYIGEAGNRELIQACFDKHYNRLVDLQQNCRTKIEYLSRIVYRIDDYTKMDNIEELRCNAIEIARNCSMLIGLDPLVKGTIKTFNREIDEFYHKEVDDCTAIIVEGFEAGGFWTKDEFDKKYKK